MTESERLVLVSKAQGVTECVKWLEEKIREGHKQLQQDYRNDKAYGMYEDCGDGYKEAVVRTKTKIDTLVDIKISLEKYSKKLIHMSDELVTL